MEKLTFAQCLDSKKSINKKIDQYDNELNSFPRQENGLISDLYRKTNEFQESKKQFNFWFNQLQAINKYLVKNYKKESREHSLKNRFKKSL